jgi:SAM-dependent methyltransferase
MDGKPLGRRNYEQFAERYAECTRTKPHNAYYERPSTLSLLPDVDGHHVLDAGCGPGHYALELLDRGAEVTAVDVTPEMVALARAELGERARVLEANLAAPLDFADDAAFDGVLCPLVLDYLEDWGPVFREFARVLRPGGWFVYSHGHPMNDYLLCRDRALPDSRYFDVERFGLDWIGFGDPVPHVVSYRRPLEAMFAPLFAAGFVLERVIEPRPVDELRAIDAEEYEKMMREPCFLCIRARKGARP